MVERYRCVVFDVDGTLLDTSEGILSAVKYTIDKYGLEPLDVDIMKSFIGPPIQNSFKRIYGFEDNVIANMATTFRDRYKGDDLLLARPYEGIYEVFENLRSIGIKTAIATYKREDYALRLLKYFHFDRYTNFICGSDFEGKLKKKDIIELALKKAEVDDFSRVLMIGDSDNDAIGAAGIGSKFLGVTYGFGFKKEEDVYQYNPIGVATNTKEIINTILGGNV